MSGIRIKFARGEEVKYISHLDMMRTFERALRRSNLPVAYSQGFNPHPQVVFGLPLSVGVTSESEYADIELTEHVNPSDFMDRLNAVLPAGIRVVDAAEKLGGPNIMASIVLASYRIYTTYGRLSGVEEGRKAVSAFLAEKEVAVEKEGKQGVKTVDIRPMVKRLEVDGCSGSLALCLTAVVSAGSKANLKPELLIAGFNKVTDLGIDILKIHRTGLFVEHGGKAVNPLDRRVLARK